MTMCVAGCLVECGGRVDPVDLARRFVDWLPTGRGTGSTVVAAVERLRSGEPWWTSGERSAGNGAAMRVAPIGIALCGDTPTLSHDAAISAVITHADPMAVAGAVGHAWLIARLAFEQPGRLDRDALVDDMAAAVSVIDDPGAPEREWQARERKSGQPVRLADRVAEVPRLLELSAHDAFNYFYNGAFVLETVPSALWCFLRYLDDPEEGVVTAVLGGHDADTVASMTGAYFGALHGERAFPARWNSDDLEFRSELRNLADQLVALPGLPTGGVP